MTAVTVREFSYNPSAIFARVEKGETIEVTRRGEVIAELIPPRRYASRYEELRANGTINPNSGTAGLTSADWDKFTHIKVPDDVDPLQILLEMREAERDRALPEDMR
jgi:antitoxin (DNA-binding transcriptional repressor) of toxin-antitoxin stability system